MTISLTKPCAPSDGSLPHAHHVIHAHMATYAKHVYSRNRRYNRTVNDCRAEKDVVCLMPVAFC